MDCPVCKNVSLMMSERMGVEIDYCPQCRGVWLDRGELDKIIEKSEESRAPAAQQPAYEERREPRDRREGHRDDDHYYKKKKRKSFISEIFDF